MRGGARQLIDLGPNTGLGPGARTCRPASQKGCVAAPPDVVPAARSTPPAAPPWHTPVARKLRARGRGRGATQCTAGCAASQGSAACARAWKWAGH